MLTSIRTSLFFLYLEYLRRPLLYLLLYPAFDVFLHYIRFSRYTADVNVSASQGYCLKDQYVLTVLSGLKWTRTTDLTLIRRAL